MDWSECRLVERDSQRLGGKPVLLGTRMPVDAILDNHDDGLTVSEISEQFGVPAAEIEQILHYAFQRRLVHSAR